MLKIHYDTMKDEVMAVQLAFASALKVCPDFSWRSRPFLGSCFKSRQQHTNQSHKAEKDAFLRAPHLGSGCRYCDAFAGFVRREL